MYHSLAAERLRLVHGWFLFRKGSNWYMALFDKYMFFVYVLQSSKDSKLYIGYTHDLDNRLAQHNMGEVASTKARSPLKLIFYEAYLNQKDALRREDYFKTTKGKRTLKVMLKEYFNTIKNI
jgi:putative endonuclease